MFDDACRVLSSDAVLRILVLFDLLLLLDPESELYDERLRLCLLRSGALGAEVGDPTFASAAVTVPLPIAGFVAVRACTTASYLRNSDNIRCVSVLSSSCGGRKVALCVSCTGVTCSDSMFVSLPIISGKVTCYFRAGRLLSKFLGRTPGVLAMSRSSAAMAISIRR